MIKINLIQIQRRPLASRIFSLVGWCSCTLLVLVATGLAWHGWLTPGFTTIELQWETATEIDTVGFNLYRAEQPTGPLTQINPTLIPASADPLAGSTYTFLDAHAVPGVVYYYYLEDLDTQGQTTRNGPQVMQAGPPEAWQWAAACGVLAIALLFVLQWPWNEPPRVAAT